MAREPFIRSVVLRRDAVPSENGSGKSTLVETIAVVAGFEAESGNHNVESA